MSVKASGKVGWRPSSVGIGSSLTLSGAKPISFTDRDKSYTAGVKTITFPKVDKRTVQSAAVLRVHNGSRNSEQKQTKPSTTITSSPATEISQTHLGVENEDQKTAIRNHYDTISKKWAKSTAYHTNSEFLFNRKRLEDSDKTFLAELDDVRKQMQSSPGQLILSIKAVMSRQRRQLVTNKVIKLNEHEPCTAVHSSNGDNVILPQCGVEDGGGGEVNTAQTVTYHSLLTAAINDKRSNSSAVPAFVNSTELASYGEGDTSITSRQTSSSSSTSLPLERKYNSKSPPQSNKNRHTKNGGTRSHDRHAEVNSLPVVCTDENINTSVHMLPINVRQSRSHQQIMQSSPAGLYPTSHKVQSSASPKTQHINSLSISGIKQDGRVSSGSRGEDTTPDEDEGRLSQLQISEKLDKLEKLPSKPPPPTPSLNLYGNQPSSASSSHQPQSGASNGSQSSQYIQPFKRRQIKSHLSLSSGRSHSKQKADHEPKYADPIAGANISFQSRLSELASLEAETVRWERLRKLKKKTRDD